MNCPNCNHHTEENYCSHCGQKNHLHKETIWSLAAHFFAHYFHFESKFRLTFKTLITCPGALAIAYHQKQRMRYVPPINLYIFLSVVFFILVNYTVKIGFVTEVRMKGAIYYAYYKYQPSFGRYNYPVIKKMQEDKYKVFDVYQQDTSTIRTVIREANEWKTDRPPLYMMMHDAFKWDFAYLYDNYFRKYLMLKYLAEHKTYSDLDAPFSAFATDYFHLLPKLFFFMMPVLGFLIGLFFSKPGMLYIDHAVLGMHAHLFLFISMACHFISGCFINLSALWWLYTSAIIIPGIYFLLSLRKMYNFSWLKTIIAGSGIWCFYIAFAFVISVMVNIVIFYYF